MRDDICLKKKLVVERLNKALRDTNFSVSYGRRAFETNVSNQYVPDVLIKQDEHLVAILEIIVGNFLKSSYSQSVLLKQRKSRLPKEYGKVLFAITDGNYCLLELHSVELFVGFEFLISILMGNDSSPYLVSPTYSNNSYISILANRINQYELEGKTRLQKWIKEHTDYNMFEENGMSLRFSTEELENDFFINLLGEVKDGKVCRYTSLGNLFMILESQKHNMCSLVCMNDRGELNYVDDKVSMQYSTVPDNPNNCFIVSMLPKKHEDELSFWRLYGCDASGACITYTVNDKLINSAHSGFYFAKVSYERGNGSHPELEFISDIVTTGLSGKVFSFRNWHIWKHFFKSRHFAREDEIRLLYVPHKDTLLDYKWIKNDAYNIVSKMLLFNLINPDVSSVHFPLSVTHVFIGPKITDSDVVAQYDYMRSSTLNTIDKVEASKISNIYR